MRRSLTVFVVAATTTLVTAIAWAGPQQVAEQIGKNIRNSGQLSEYKLAVSYEDGTARLTGRVRNREQMMAALRVAIETPGVERVVNNISIGTGDAKEPEATSMGRPSAASQATLSSLAAFRPEQGSSPEPTLFERLDVATAVRKPARGQQTAGSYNAAVRQAAAVEAEPTLSEEAPRMIRQGSRGSQAPPIPISYLQRAAASDAESVSSAGPMPMYTAAASRGGVAPVRYDQPHLPNYAWPSYASYPNYAAVTYPKQYSPTAWPFIGPFYPYPQVPLGWRKVTLEWDDGWWMLDFKDRPSSWEGPLGRWY